MLRFPHSSDVSSKLKHNTIGDSSKVCQKRSSLIEEGISFRSKLVYDSFERHLLRRNIFRGVVLGCTSRRKSEADFEMDQYFEMDILQFYFLERIDPNTYPACGQSSHHTFNCLWIHPVQIGLELPTEPTQE